MNVGPVFSLGGRTVPAKLVVNKPGDAYEREANAAAARVTSGQAAPALSQLLAGGLGNTAQRQEADEETLSSEATEATAEVLEEEEEAAPTEVQRQVEEEEEEIPLTKGKGGGHSSGGHSGGGRAGSAAGPSSGARAGIQSMRGGGQPLSGGSQSFFGSRFGHDFSRVRVHTDPKAAQLSDDLNARAFTTGHHIAFGAGEYQPRTPEGDILLAHELAHVVQQQGATPTQETGTGHTALEEEADLAATSAVSSRWGGVQEGLSNVGRTTMPRLKSGLRLQRCDKASKADKKKIAETKKILDTIPTGKEALAIQKKYKVGIKIAKGKGYYFDPSSNTVVLDESHSAARSALDFVHEMHHAKYHHEGLGADASKLGRHAYIKGKVKEEAEGTVKSIEAKIELEGTKIDVSRAVFPLEAEYRKAYKTAVAAAKAKDPKISEADAKKKGKAAGRKAVFDGFMNGKVTTSTTNETYPDYYGKYWDKVHTK